MDRYYDNMFYAIEDGDLSSLDELKITFNDIREQVDKTEKEKQDLIKYLEDKIKEYKDSDLFSSAGKVTAYQEILDKIKEGNYE